MLRRVIEGSVILVALGIAAALGAARLWQEPGEGFYWRAAALARMSQDAGPVDFSALQRRERPNDTLVCPESLCQKAKSDLVAPVFPVPAAELRRKVSLVVMSEPNSAELSCADDCGRTARFVEYSALFEFPDTIDVRVVDAGANASTLAIYSRSVFGYWDFGVNSDRAARWLAALKRITPQR